MEKRVHSVLTWNQESYQPGGGGILNNAAHLNRDKIQHGELITQKNENNPNKGGGGESTKFKLQ